jgi:hypothetical protein
MTSVKERRIAALRRAVAATVFIVFVTAFYVFLISAGTWTSWHTWSAIYDAQAEGLRSGHLYLPLQPSPALLALKDPLDPANMRLWRWDHSYFAGHFYICWGLVPGLLLAAVKTLFRVHAQVGDEALTLCFAVGRLIAGTLLLRATAAQMRSAPRPWAMWVAVVVFALASPTPYLLNRGAVYEASIFAGACFMVAGLALGLRALDSSQALRWLALASLSFGLAGGSRPSLIPAATLLALHAAWARWRADGGRRDRLFAVAAAGCAPAAATIALHLLLNKLRFGAWGEFGLHYQMGGPFVAGLRFVVSHVYLYLFHRPSVGCAFPWLAAQWKTSVPLSPPWLPFASDQIENEPMVGLFTAAPFALLAIVPIATALFRRLRRAVPDATPAERWLRGALVIYAVAAATPLLVVSSSSLRYQADFASAIFVLAALGGWRWLAAPRSPAGRRAAAAGYLLLAAVTIAAGLVLGFGGYFNHFVRHNPAFGQRVERALSVCGR